MVATYEILIFAAVVLEFADLHEFGCRWGPPFEKTALE
jgi:hypothetical protein